MAEQATTIGTARPKRRRRLWYLVAAIVVGIFVWLWLDYWNDWSGQRHLARVVAELDERDPHWKWDDLHDGRKKLPEDEDGARYIWSVQELNTAGWVTPTVLDGLTKAARNKRLDPELATTLREGLAATPALHQARRIAEFPHGWLPRPVDDMTECGAAWILLRLDANLRADQGDTEGALASCRGMWHYSRYVRVEPNIVSFGDALTTQLYALPEIERVLGQGTVTDATLRAWITMIQDDDRFPWISQAFRGERAEDYHRYQLFCAGQLPADRWQRWQPLNNPSPYKTGYAFVDNRLDKWNTRRGVGPPIRNLAMTLEYWTELIEIEALPFEEQAEAVLQGKTRWQALPKGCPHGWDDWYSETYLKHKANLRCFLVALAVERFRLANGHWPDLLDELTPKFLPQVPNGPYVKGPLRYLRLADGVLVYCLGPKSLNVGLDASMSFPGGEYDQMRFRLWDPDKRGLPVMPEKEKGKSP